MRWKWCHHVTLVLEEEMWNGVLDEDGLSSKREACKLDEEKIVKCMKVYK